MEKIEFTINGYSELGSWSIKRFMKVNPNEDMEVIVSNLVDMFSQNTEHKNWTHITWTFPLMEGIGTDINCLAERSWFDTIKCTCV